MTQQFNTLAKAPQGASRGAELGQRVAEVLLVGAVLLGQRRLLQRRGGRWCRGFGRGGFGRGGGYFFSGGPAEPFENGIVIAAEPGGKGVSESVAQVPLAIFLAFRRATSACWASHLLIGGAGVGVGVGVGSGGFGAFIGENFVRADVVPGDRVRG